MLFRLKKNSGTIKQQKPAFPFNIKRLFVVSNALLDELVVDELVVEDVVVGVVLVAKSDL